MVLAGVALVARGAVPCDLLEQQPECLVAFLPGPTRDTFELIEIDSETSDSEGELVLTTVLLDTTITLREWVDYLFDATITTYDRDLIYPPGTDEEDIDQQNTILMQDSQIEATIAALVALGYDVSTEPIGMYVAGLAEDNLIREGDLEVGDALVSIEGQSVVTIDDIIAALEGHGPGDVVEVTRRREGEEPVTVEVELVESPDERGRPLIGILLGPDYDLPVDVSIEAGSIGGPSAGLMFALSIVDSLTPEDLTAGAIIAGTGAIDANGNVGAIGGIQQKIVGALHRDDEPAATVFLVPQGNFDEARSAPVDDQILLVPVSTINEALDVLAALANGDTPSNAVAIGP
jgi:PDZ domain-containing protein